MKLVLLLLLLFLPIAVMGQSLSGDEAAEVAVRYLQTKELGYLGVEEMEFEDSILEARELRGKKTNSRKPFFIFNDEYGGAFVLVAGDSRMGTVLGWSDAGTFPMDDIPDGLMDLLNMYARWFDSLDESMPKEGGEKTFDNYPVVQPLIRSHWGQGNPFNYLCPKNGSTHCLAGCVATAMAQILHAHQYPAKGIGFFSYRSAGGYDCSFPFEATLFDWKNMRNDYSGRYLDAERDAVAQLMYACAVSVGMDFSVSGSGAFCEDVPYALRHFFAYNDSVAYYVRDYFPTEEWDSIICHELVNGRPILYSGSKDDQSGHAFLLDGCDGHGLFHFNWGWSGSADGYFSIDALSPLGGNPYGLWQGMVCHIIPRKGGLSEDVFYADSLVVDEGPIAMGEKLHFEVLEVCCASNKFSSIDSLLWSESTVGVALYNDKMQFVQWLDIPDEVDVNYSVVYKLWYEIPLDPQVFTEGTVWWLVPAAQSDNVMTPTPMHVYNPNKARIPLVVQDGVAYVGYDELPNKVIPIEENSNNTALFDLSGRQILQPSRGVYIQNGCKRWHW